MEKTLKEILEGLLNTLDPSKEVVTESIREDISGKFITAVTEAVKAESNKIDEAVAAQIDALNTQIDSLKEAHEAEKKELLDEGVAAVASVDEEFAGLLEFAIDQFDKRAVAKLEECQAAFDHTLDKEIEDLCETVEQIVETKLEEATSDEDISKLAKLEKLEQAFESMRAIFFKDAVLEQKVTESVGTMKSEFDKLLSQNIAMAKKLNKIEVDSFLESSTEGLKPALKKYLVERFENDKIDEIKESWDTAIDDYKKLDEENRLLAAKNAKKLDVNGKIDESQEEDDEPKEDLNESYYAQMAKQYSKFF